MKLRQQFPAVVVLGARQVGKSTLLGQVAPGAHFFDLENAAHYERLSVDPALVFRELTGDFVFDEAQRLPTLFDALRVEIDRDRHRPGRFLLSGSSSPELLHNISESLAGRCAIVEMGTLSWGEAEDLPESNFCAALTSGMAGLKSLTARHSTSDLLDKCFYGGYPEPYLKRREPAFFDTWMAGYIRTYLERDVRALFPSLNLEAYRRFVKMASFASGEALNLSKFAGSLDVSQPTVKRYLEILEGTFLWRRLPAFDRNSRKRVVKSFRGYFRDTGLGNYLQDIFDVDALKSHPNYGRIWESFVSENIVRQFQAQLVRANFYHYRTSNQTEVDLVVEGAFGIVPIEIKSGSVTSASRLRGLKNFIADFDCPFGIVVNQGSEVFRLSDRIMQVPATFI